jgi:hypothetical protein
LNYNHSFMIKSGIFNEPLGCACFMAFEVYPAMTCLKPS